MKFAEASTGTRADTRAVYALDGNEAELLLGAITGVVPTTFIYIISQSRLPSLLPLSPLSRLSKSSTFHKKAYLQILPIVYTIASL
jgi:hypothetical protein